MHIKKIQNYMDLKYLVSITIGIPTVTATYSGFGERFDDYTLEILLKPPINRFGSASNMFLSPIMSITHVIFSARGASSESLERVAVVRIFTVNVTNHDMLP